MTRRSRAREVALQLLFQRDANPDVPRPVIEQFARDRLGNPDAEAFCLSLYDGVSASLKEIDPRITAASENWKLHRMAAVDRNVLRLAIYEMLHREDIPPVVSINEGVDIAKKFSTQDSGKFVNGILDKIKSELLRPARVVK